MHYRRAVWVVIVIDSVLMKGFSWAGLRPPFAPLQQDLGTHPYDSWLRHALQSLITIRSEKNGHAVKLRPTDAYALCLTSSPNTAPELRS